MTTDTRDLTKNQTLVFDALSQAQTPLGAYTILDKLRDHGFRAPLQVYRALDKLLDFGLVHRLESINAFVACSHAQCHATGFIAFAICDSCGQVSEFSDQVIAKRLDAWAADQAFKATKKTIEIRGACADCTAM